MDKPQDAKWAIVWTDTIVTQYQNVNIPVADVYTRETGTFEAGTTGGSDKIKGNYAGDSTSTVYEKRAEAVYHHQFYTDLKPIEENGGLFRFGLPIFASFGLKRQLAEKILLASGALMGIPPEPSDLKSERDQLEESLNELRKIIRGERPSKLMERGESQTPPAEPAIVKESKAEPSPVPQPATQPIPPTVLIKSTPDGAEITIDGKFMGSTPSTIILAPGEHEVIIHKIVKQEPNRMGITVAGGKISVPAYKDWKRTLTLNPGSTITIDATLEKAQ